MTGWIAGSWATPYYYDYGSTVYYYDNVVYANNQPLCTADEYYDQAAALAYSYREAFPEETAEAVPAEEATPETEWMPLGVFALVTNDQEKDPVMMLQLAVNKQGLISGTYYNSSTDTTLPVEGAVDRETQRAAWTIGEKKSTILEAGIFNLTQDETPVLVHFGKEKTQTWLMVRLDTPESDKSTPPNPAAMP